MSDIQQAINERIDAFVAEITELAKQAALETLAGGLSSGRRGGDKGLSSTRVRRKSGKRSPEEIAETADQLLGYIRENPGQRMEAIAKALDSTTKDLTLPIKKLLSQGHVRVEGQKRATSYYPATSKSKTKGGRRRRSKKRS
jgi:hypothetical protein